MLEIRGSLLAQSTWHIQGNRYGFTIVMSVGYSEGMEILIGLLPFALLWRISHSLARQMGKWYGVSLFCAAATVIVSIYAYYYFDYLELIRLKRYTAASFSIAVAIGAGFLAVLVAFVVRCGLAATLSKDDS